MVNGGLDQKAYLLVLAPYVDIAKEHLRQYRLRINPIGRRETRFRDILPGIPSVIHIDQSTQQNLDLLESLSSKDIWIIAPASVRGLTSNDNNKSSSMTRGVKQSDSSHSSTTPRGQTYGSTGPKPSTSSIDMMSTYGSRRSYGIYTISHTVSWHTFHSVLCIITPTPRARGITPQATTGNVIGKYSNFNTNCLSTLNSLAHIETKLGRLDNMDSLLNNNRVKLALTMKQQQDSHVQIVELNI